MARKTSQGFAEFNYNEIKKYKLENILVYIEEFQYEGKTIALQKQRDSIKKKSEYFRSSDFREKTKQL